MALWLAPTFPTFPSRRYGHAQHDVPELLDSVRRAWRSTTRACCPSSPTHQSSRRRPLHHCLGSHRPARPSAQRSPDRCSDRAGSPRSPAPPVEVQRVPEARWLARPGQEGVPSDLISTPRQRHSFRLHKADPTEAEKVRLHILCSAAFSFCIVSDKLRRDDVRSQRVSLTGDGFCIAAAGGAGANAGCIVQGASLSSLKLLDLLLTRSRLLTRHLVAMLPSRLALVSVMMSIPSRLYGLTSSVDVTDASLLNTPRRGLTIATEGS